MSLPIIYCDNHLVAINKPSGLLVHRSPIDKKSTRFAVQALRNQLGQHVFPIHRLDKPTSGVLLFARDAHTARILSQHWDAAYKGYLALCRGNVVSQYIDHPITTHPDRGDHFREAKVQDAQTTVTNLKRITLPIGFGKLAQQYPTTTFSLVHACIHTGRKHQIRKHLKHINHPIIGDTGYGRGEINRYFRADENVARLMLHCHSIQIPHPMTNKPIMIHAPLDSTWQNWLLRHIGNCPH